MSDHDEYLIAIGFDPDEWHGDHSAADVLAGDGDDFADLDDEQR